jgi:hypothetical protein
MTMRLLALVIIVFAVSACDEDKLQVSCNEGVAAIVRDLTGLDGCGFVFELEDGTRLEPYMTGYCGTPPLPKEVTENPLYNFEWVDGKEVIIGFEEVKDAASICMAGPIVKITCLQEVITDEKL